MKTLLAVLMAWVLTGPARAATQADAEAAVTAAAQIESQAEPGNRWVPAEAALKAARSALIGEDWDTAAAQAATARALALRSVEQSKEQQTAWHDAAIR